MKVDYIIHNGIMFDFDTGKTYTGDLYIKDGRIVHPKDETVVSERTVDATGKLVVPGLIDEHGHWARSTGSLGMCADQICPGCGVTTAVDAGSTGTENFEAFYREDVLRSKTNLLAYLHVAPHGVMAGGAHEEEQDPGDVNEAKIFRLFEKYSHCLKGLKVRISAHTLKYGFGLESLKAAVDMADKLNAAGYACAVAVHVAELPDEFDIQSVLELLRPGDVYTHLYQNVGPTIFDTDSRVKECVKAARERGVLFSSGNGGKHWSFENLKNAYADGFYPDFITADVVDYNMYLRPGFNMLYALNTSLLSGMDLVDVFRAVTVDPARHLGLLPEVGTLNPGSWADVAIFDWMDAKVDFVDRFGGKVEADKVLVPLMTFKAGKPVFRQIFFGGGVDYPTNLKTHV